MFNTSQVVIRNQHLLESTATLVMNPPPDQLLLELTQPVQVLTWDFSVYQTLTNQRVANVEFAPVSSGDEHFAQALIFMPKSQAEFDLLWATARARLKPAATVWIVGEKREGINTAAKRLQSQNLSLVKLDSARHCQLWRVTGVNPAAAPELKTLFQTFSVACGERSLQVASLPGVFNVGRLDEGTALLLEHLGEVPAGRLLDFGCGAGVIGACLKARQPAAQVELVDIHALALASTRETLALNGLEGKVYPSDGLAQVEGRYRGIYTNPPFHTGVKTDYRITANLIREARERLEKGGELRLVANAFLHYPDLIRDVFGNCETLAETTRFKAYRAVRTS